MRNTLKLWLWEFTGFFACNHMMEAAQHALAVDPLWVLHAVVMAAMLLRPYLAANTAHHKLVNYSMIQVAAFYYRFITTWCDYYFGTDYVRSLISGISFVEISFEYMYTKNFQYKRFVFSIESKHGKEINRNRDATKLRRRYLQSFGGPRTYLPKTIPLVIIEHCVFWLWREKLECSEARTNNSGSGRKGIV